MVSDGAFRLLSGMSVNQSRSVQSNLWQETTSLWDTPAAHLYASQHHKQLSRGEGRGGRSTAAVRGEMCFHFFPHFLWQRRPNKCCSISLTIAHSFESLCSPPVLALKRFPPPACPITAQRLLHDRAAQAACPTQVPTSQSGGHRWRSNWNDLNHFQTRAQTWTVMQYSCISRTCRSCTPVVGHWILNSSF